MQEHTNGVIRKIRKAVTETKRPARTGLRDHTFLDQQRAAEEELRAGVQLMAAREELAREQEETKRLGAEIARLNAELAESKAKKTPKPKPASIYLPEGEAIWNPAWARVGVKVD